MIWATVSSRSCFCWLSRASPSLAAKNIINLISVLTIWWCQQGMVHVIRLTTFFWLWFQCVCPLMPSHNTYRLTWVSLTLDEGCLHTAIPLDLERGVAPLSPPVPAQPPFLGRGFAPLSQWPTSVQFSSVAQLCLTLWPHESQHARPPCPSPIPRVHSDSHPSSQWCHPAISSSVVPFLLLPPIPPSIRVFSNESTLCMR